MSLKHLRTLLTAASCFATITTLGHGEEYTTIPPLPTITVANFARTNETFDFVSANAEGQKTFWAVKISISSTGMITGSAKVEKYKADGSSDGKPATVKIAEGSKIYGPNPIPPINSMLTDEGGNDKEQRADYRADVIIKFANGFVARGKLTYEHSIYFDAYYSELSSSLKYWGNDDSDEFPSISITGPNGHIGFID